MNAIAQYQASANNVPVKISRKKLEQLHTDNERSASAVNLVYQTDAEPGICRQKKGTSYSYTYNGKPVTDEKTLARIKSLVIPPAWQNVWISKAENGHMQATGTDVRGRKQYIYHPLWTAIRSQTKFSHLYEFGKVLPAIRKQLNAHLALKDTNEQKVLATVISLLQCTCIRIGNSMYEKLYGSFGLTTLKDKHVTISGHKLEFEFKGKKGVYHKVTLKSKRLAKIVQQCKDIPGKELFQYYDENGNRKSIDSGMVNNYIKEISGGNFTAKDFRTWSGTLRAIEIFKELDVPENETQLKKAVNDVMDGVALHLGNTKAVCRKYYVHPIVVDLYANKSLQKFIAKKSTAVCDDSTVLSEDEVVLMNILESATTTVVA